MRHSQLSEASKCLEEADQHKKRGEKRRGVDSIRHLEMAVQSYERAICLGLEHGDMAEAHFGMAWCLQLAGTALLEAAGCLPDSEVSRSSEIQAREAAAKMYQRAVEAYDKALDESGRIREDAAVNKGNTLCSLAELMENSSKQQQLNSSSLDSQAQVSLASAYQAFEEARQSYQWALNQVVSGYRIR
jgi:hypothetical protein